MSKRHQSSRRRAYGRRQHELRERVTRRPEDESEPVTEHWLDEERFARFDTEPEESVRTWSRG